MGGHTWTVYLPFAVAAKSGSASCRDWMRVSTSELSVEPMKRQNGEKTLPHAPATLSRVFSGKGKDRFAKA